MMRSPRSTQQAIISRFKIMADMDIAENRKPQDGHCALTIGGHKMDFRVSTLPTVYGERIVLRILRKDNILLRLEDLGFIESALERFESSFRKPYGAILVTGPTGSGKSTSLYAAINVLNDPGKHILTAEDPVEYRLPGVNQVQTNVRAGLTFAKALRSFLRCSPDIILVGEIRDQETANIAIESALTGHLVLSTLHTNDAAGAITRLTEMGVEPFLVASAVDCVLAQLGCDGIAVLALEPATHDLAGLIADVVLEGGRRHSAYLSDGWCPRGHSTHSARTAARMSGSMAAHTMTRAISSTDV
jgi:type IV pilus assembly protein PilB